MLFNMPILPLMKSAVVTMPGHKNAGAAAAAVLCSASEFFERFHSWCRLTTLRYHVKCNFVLRHDLSHRECASASVTSACRQVCTVQE